MQSINKYSSCLLQKYLVIETKKDILKVNTFRKKRRYKKHLVYLIESDTASFGKSIDVLRITWHFIGTLGLGSYISDHSGISAQNFLHDTISAPVGV